jgi:two-component sensor histidine kinase
VVNGWKKRGITIFLSEIHMKTIKYFLLAFIMLILAARGNAQDLQYTITCKPENFSPMPAKIYFVEPMHTGVLAKSLDSSEVKNGEYHFGGKLLANQATEVQIATTLAKKADQTQVFGLMNDKGDFQVVSEGSVTHSKIIGTGALAQHQFEEMRLADSNYVISRTRQAEELEVKYATAEKENQIALLNQKAKLEQGNFNKAMLVKNVTTGGFALVAIIAGLLYRQSTLRKKNNELLERLLIEKDWLLKEVNHRVKNNLHMVISLLESQAMYLENDALKAMQSSKHRIFSMSLIHQKLYQSDDVKTIDMSVYLPELVNYLRDSFGAGRLIHFSLEVEPVQLSIAKAIPLALVLNEAITNSIKYAFPGNRRGEISIKMRQTGENIELIIMDNGVGMVKAMEDTDSLGLKLMRGLVEEIGGQIQFENKNGMGITIAFEINLLVELEK